MEADLATGPAGLGRLGKRKRERRRRIYEAAVELFRELSRKNPEAGLERQLQGFRRACEQLGLVLPENVEALIVLDRQFTGEHA